MSLLLVFNRQSGRRGRIGTLIPDATISEGHSRANRVTQWPVEDGSTISDHIANESKRLTVEGFVTDSPLESGEQFEQHVQSAYRQLNDMWRERTLLEVVTQYEVYRDMAIEKIDIPKARQTGEALRFTVAFVQIRKVSSRLVEIPPDILPPRDAPSNGPTGGTIPDQGTTETDTGRQTPIPTVESPPVTPPDRSPIQRIIDGFGRLTSPLFLDSPATSVPIGYFVIPVNPELPAQRLEVPLSGNVYQLALRWNTRDFSWSLDIATRDRVALIDGLKLVLNHELLDRFADERLPDGYLIAFDSTGKKTTIERFDLGNTVQLVFVPRSEYTP